MLAAVSTCALISAQAYAEVTATANIFYPSTTFGNTNSDPVAASASIVRDGSAGAAFADLSAGILRADALAASFGPQQTNATALLRERFTINSGFGETAFLDWSFEGTAVLGAPANPALVSAANGEFSLALFRDSVIGPPGSGTLGTVQRLLFNFTSGPGRVPLPCETDVVSQCVYGSAIALSGSIPFLIAAGNYDLSTALRARAAYGGVADFGNTSRLYLRLPAGVSITSQSGQLFATASPVPEASTVAMWAIGLLGLCMAVRRRRRSA